MPSNKKRDKKMQKANQKKTNGTANGIPRNASVASIQSIGTVVDILKNSTMS